MNNRKMVFRNDGAGEYHVRILMSKEQCHELKLEYPIEVDIFVEEAIGSQSWEETMREEIEDALFETVFPADADEFYQSVYEDWFAEIAWNWDLEEEVLLSEDRDPFSDKNREKTLKAYRLLYSSMIADGREKEIRKMFQDEDYAKNLFEVYHIPGSPYML